MAERDETIVMVRLDRARFYRKRPEDKDVIWVGPGVMPVPRWQAEAWELEELGVVETPVTTFQQSVPPFAGFDDLNANEVVDRLVDLDDAGRAAVQAYEAAHKKRVTVLRALEQGQEG